jgi:hypothetical protein
MDVFPAPVCAATSGMPSCSRTTQGRGCCDRLQVRGNEWRDKKRRQPGDELTPEFGLRGRGELIFDPLFRFHHQAFRADDAPERGSPCAKDFHSTSERRSGLTASLNLDSVTDSTHSALGQEILPRLIFSSAGRNVDEARAGERAGALDQQQSVRGKREREIRIGAPARRRTKEGSTRDQGTRIRHADNALPRSISL